MKRLFTATCLATMCAVGLAAQSTSTPQDPQTPGAGRGAPRTVTGCLRAGDTAGTYMLTDVQMQGGGRRGGDPTAAGGTTAGGTTAGTGTTAAGATGTAPQGGRAMTPQSIMLTAASDVDLKPHVGHKIEVTGTMMGGRGAGGATAGATTGTATGTTATGTTAGGTTTGGTATATGTGSGSGAGQGAGRMRSMTVTTVRMVSESCS